MPENDNDNLPTVPQAPMGRRLVMRRRQSMSVATALFYIQSKPEIDAEYREILEAIIDCIVRNTGVGNMDVADVEQSKPEPKTQ